MAQVKRYLPVFIEYFLVPKKIPCVWFVSLLDSSQFEHESFHGFGNPEKRTAVVVSSVWQLSNITEPIAQMPTQPGTVQRWTWERHGQLNFTFLGTVTFQIEHSINRTTKETRKFQYTFLSWHNELALEFELLWKQRDAPVRGGSIKATISCTAHVQHTVQPG